MAQACPVCETVLVKTETQGDRYLFECSRCGPFSLSGTATATIECQLNSTPNSRAILSHALYKMTKREQWTLLYDETIKQILSQVILPTPQQQLENLIIWFGRMQSNPGDEIDVTDQTIAAIGAANKMGLGFVIEHSIERGFVKGIAVPLGYSYSFTSMKLSFEGWSIFEDLQRGNSASRAAFMAMQFNDTQLDEVYTPCFKAATEQSGFDLKKLDEGQPAGLIDDRLRVEIRQARFLIADLTHQNRGAYWEAGFAEGLGKPVIYTCRKDVFDEKDNSRKPHFDKIGRAHV